MSSKKVFVATVKCPNCKGIIEIIKEVEVIQEAVKAEKKERYYAEKSVQTTLQGEDE